MNLTLLPLHVLGGLAAIVSGFVALFVVKGGGRHRRSGTVFVYTMLVMALTGVVMAAIRGNGGNVMGGSLAAYLVVTGLLTVRRPAAGVDAKDVAALFLGLGVVAAGAAFGAQALLSPRGTRFGYPAPLYFAFGSAALLACIGDVRLLAARGIQGTRRLVRHLWRMTLGLWIATASFFLGQAKVMPAPIRHNIALRSVPVLIVLGALLYWLVRVRLRRRAPAEPPGSPAVLG